MPTESNKKKTPALPLNARPRALRSIEYETATWFMTVKQEVHPDHLLDPKFWALCANRMASNQLVHVVAEDQSWYARLLVLTAAQSGARVAMLELSDLTKVRTSPTFGPEDEVYRVEFNSASKWRVVRNSDNMEIGRDMTKAQAEALISERRVVDAR